MTEYRTFLESVWGEQQGQVCISRMNNEQLKNHKFFSWPEQAEDLFKYVDRYTHEDVYFPPVLFKANKRQRVLASTCQVVYGDADLFNLDDVLCEPSIIVRTSPEKTHLYWMIDGMEDAQLAETLSHSVSVAHPKKSTGFDDGWSCTKLLRIPGTTNTKYVGETGEVYQVTVEYTGVTYTQEEFEGYYPPVPEYTMDFKPFPAEDMPSYGKVLSELPASTRLEGLLQTAAFPKKSAGSEALYALYTELMRMGATDEQVYAIAERSPLNKWKRDGVDDAGAKLWADIQRARAKDGQFEEDEEDEDDEDEIITVAPKPKSKGFDFLTDEEKQNLKPCFIDNYLAWTRSKSDAPDAYNVAGAFSVLSTVFGDFGHAVPHWGDVPLNLWFMVLGSTTLSRKSTAKGFMMKSIEALEAEGFSYDLGSKFTAEGLDEALRANANRSALLHIDEIQGLMKQLDSKAYLAGIKGELTEIYDGKVTGKLRASGEEKDKKRKGARVAMNLFAMGIKEQLADYLTEDDFQSGFLTRFIWVSAQPLERTAETDYIGQQDKTERTKGDPAFLALMDQIRHARSIWCDWNDPTERTIAVPMTEEAHKRYNVFITAALDAAEVQSKATILTAATARLSTSILKAATLLAMVDLCDEVQLKHMLVAINYCGEWFEHLVDMTKRISESNWKRRQDKLMEAIFSKGGELSWPAAYRLFNAEMKAREFTELVQSLEEAGQVIMSKNKKTKSLIAVEGF
jgi:hypothetical protein